MRDSAHLVRRKGNEGRHILKMRRAVKCVLPRRVIHTGSSMPTMTLHRRNLGTPDWYLVEKRRTRESFLVMSKHVNEAVRCKVWEEALWIVDSWKDGCAFFYRDFRSEEEGEQVFALLRAELLMRQDTSPERLQEEVDLRSRIKLREWPDLNACNTV